MPERRAPGENIKVASIELNVGPHVRNSLRAVQKHFGSITVRHLDRLLRPSNRPKRIRNVRKRDQPRARPQQLDLGQRQPRFELTAAATQGKLAQAQKDIRDAEVVAATTEGRLRGIDTTPHYGRPARVHAANGQGTEASKSLAIVLAEATRLGEQRTHWPIMRGNPVLWHASSDPLPGKSTPGRQCETRVG